jgi:hypothetical protein
MDTGSSDQAERYPPASPETLYARLELNETNAVETIRCICELSFFENSIARNKPTLSAARDRVLKIPHPDLTLLLEKLVNDEWSSFGRRRKEFQVDVLEFLDLDEPKSWLVVRKKVNLPLPVKAFTREAQQRMYTYLTKSLREDIAELHDERQKLTYPDLAITKLNGMLQKLAKQFAIRENLEPKDKEAELKASLARASAEYNSLKLNLECASPAADTTRLESRLKKAGAQKATLASQLQEFRRSQTIKAPSVSSAPPPATSSPPNT